MTLAVALTLASAAAFLVLALLMAVRTGQRALGVPMALMCLAMSTYNALDALGSITQNVLWDWLAYCAAALLTIPTWILVVRFVGMGRRLRLATYALGAYFAAVAISTLLPALLPVGRPQLVDYPGGSLWSLVMLVGLLPACTTAVVLLIRHTRRSRGEERARVRLLSGALALGVGGSMLDLVLIISGSALRLSAVTLLISAALTAGLVSKAKVLEGVTKLTLVNVAVLAMLAIIGHLLVFSLAGARLAVTVFGSLVVLLGLLAAVRPLLATLSEQRSRSRYLATLGRFSEQMAHDIRNPLAAIKGSAQFLQEELAQGRSMDPHGEFVELIIERVQRLERVVKDYQRMGRVVPVRAAMSINELVEDVVEHHALDQEGAVEVELTLAEDLPQLSADRDLLAYALENLVRNAVEAMPQGGTLVAITERIDTATGSSVRLRVRDSGCGMDPRAQENAFEDFFTTKAAGSGLGLPFVARVVEAHGGSIDLHSVEQVGTTVEMLLPVSS